MIVDKHAVGMVGLGLIGTSLARRLISASYTVYGYDIDVERCARLASLGGQAAASLRDVGRNCRTVILAVFNTDQVESAVEGQDGLAPLELAAGQVVICTSTCDPDRIAMLAERVARSGVNFLEVPLSGNSDQIARGNGVGLVGGDPQTMEAVATILDAICPRRYYLGPVGAGGRAKLAVNLVGGLNRAVMAEGLAFAESMGLDLSSFLEVLKGSAAYSRTMDNRGDKMVRNDFTPHAKISQSLKDFQLMRNIADRAGQPLPLATVYIDLIEACLAHGEADLDNSAIIKEIRRRRLKRNHES